MAARLLVIVLFLVGLLAAGLGVPLALSYAQARQLAMFTDRLTDTIFYASLAERVLVDTEVRGVAVTVSPTNALRAEELRVWSLVVAAGLAALAMGVVVALPIVRWIL